MTNSVLAKMVVEIMGKTAQFEAAVARSSKSLGMFEKGIGRVGKAMGIAFGAQQIYQGLEHGVQVMADFERQMDTVAAITGATDSEIKQLSQSAIDLAGAFSSIDIARMQTELGRLGLSTKEIMDSTTAIVNLATATGEDLAKSADTVGSTLRIYNISAKESGKVTDIMAAAFNTSALALDNFTEAIKYVGPVANAAGISLEQTSALLGVLADNGIRGSMAGTSLRKIISDLGKGAGPELTRKLKEMAAAGLSGAEAMDEVGRTAYASLLVLANNTQKIDAQTAAFKESQGAAAATAKIMGDNLATDANKAAAAWDAMFIAGSRLLPVFRGLTQAWTAGLKNVSGTNNVDDYFRKALDAAQRAVKYGYTGNKLKETIEALEKAASDAGRNVGFVWDETGEKIRKAFEIDHAAGAMGPFPATGDNGVILPFIQPKKKEAQQYFPKDLDYQMAVNRMAWDEEKRFQDSLKMLNEQGSKDFDAWYKEWNDKEYNASLEQTEILQGAADERDRIRKQEIQGMKKQAQAAMTVGMVISDALVDTIESGESFGRAITKQVSGAVNQLYRLAVAYMIEKSIANSGPFPLVGVAMATAGVISINGLFAGVRVNQEAKSEGLSVSQYRAMKRNGETSSEVNFRIRGQDLHGTLTNYDRSRTRTGT